MFLSIIVLPEYVSCEPVNVTPFKIILNARNAEDIQAIISMSMTSGYRLSGFDVTIQFGDNDEVLFNAFSFRYCAIDDNFLARYDRQEIINDAYIASLAGQTVTAIVSGSYTAVSLDGTHIITIDFEGSDQVQILKPGKSKK